MKNHVITYSQWSRVHESEHDQRYEDLKTLVDLGMAGPHELEAYRKSNYGSAVRVEFMEKLRGMFRDLEINPRDMSSPIQRRRDTYVFQLSPAQAVKILFEYPIPVGNSQNRRTRLAKLFDRIRPHVDELVAISDRVIRNRSSIYQFFIMPADARLAVTYGKPSSNRFMKFNGVDDADELLVKFVNQVALETMVLIRDIERTKNNRY